MAVSYTATAVNTLGTTVATNRAYKDVTATAATGDLIVAFGISAQIASSTAGSIATQAGSTGAWQDVASNNTDSTPGWTSGWAVASASGSVTVRITVPNSSSPSFMGSAIWIIPAAEWSGTPAFTTMAIHDADAKLSVVIAAQATVLYGAGDWSALAPGSTSTPAGAVEDTTYSDGTQYAVVTRHWTGQAAGTRSYGPTSPAGADWAGRIAVVQEITIPADPGAGYVLETGLGSVSKILLTGVGGGSERLSTQTSAGYSGFGIRL